MSMRHRNVLGSLSMNANPQRPGGMQTEDLRWASFAASAAEWLRLCMPRDVPGTGAVGMVSDNTSQSIYRMVNTVLVHFMGQHPHRGPRHVALRKRPFAGAPGSFTLRCW